MRISNQIEESTINSALLACRIAMNLIFVVRVGLP